MPAGAAAARPGGADPAAALTGDGGWWVDPATRRLVLAADPRSGLLPAGSPATPATVVLVLADGTVRTLVLGPPPVPVTDPATLPVGPDAAAPAVALVLRDPGLPPVVLVEVPR